MALAWSAEWLELQMKTCREDADFQEEAEALDRSFTARVFADPDNGVPEDLVYGFHVPTMDRPFVGTDDAWDTDYLLEGSYQLWKDINEGRKGLVASLLDESMGLKRGSTSYLAMFVPAVERFFELSREVTTEYAGGYAD